MVAIAIRPVPNSANPALLDTIRTVKIRQSVCNVRQELHSPTLALLSVLHAVLEVHSLAGGKLLVLCAVPATS